MPTGGCSGTHQKIMASLHWPPLMYRVREHRVAFLSVALSSCAVDEATGGLPMGATSGDAVRGNRLDALDPFNFLVFLGEGSQPSHSGFQTSLWPCSLPAVSGGISAPTVSLALVVPLSTTGPVPRGLLLA